MQAALTYVLVGGLGFLILNVVGPVVAVWDWLRSPRAERFR